MWLMGSCRKEHTRYPGSGERGKGRVLSQETDEADQIRAWNDHIQSRIWHIQFQSTRAGRQDRPCCSVERQMRVTAHCRGLFPSCLPTGRRPCSSASHPRLHTRHACLSVWTSYPKLSRNRGRSRERAGANCLVPMSHENWRIRARHAAPYLGRTFDAASSVSSIRIEGIMRLSRKLLLTMCGRRLVQRPPACAYSPGRHELSDIVDTYSISLDSRGTGANYAG